MQPDKQPRARLHSLISQSSKGPHESEGAQTPPQMLPGCIPPGRGRHRSFSSFRNGEGLHVYQSLPIASVSAILTDK